MSLQFNPFTGTFQEVAVVNWAAPGAIGSTTPNIGAFTTLSASGTATLGDTINLHSSANYGITHYDANTTTFRVGQAVNASVAFRNGSFDEGLWVHKGIAFWPSTSLAPETYLYTGGPGILEQRDGANAQLIRIFQSYTNGSNGAWGFIDTTTPSFVWFGSTGNGTGVGSNHMRVGPDGTGCNLYLRSGGVDQWGILGGNLLALGAYNIGDGAGNSPPYVYAETAFVSGGNVEVPANGGYRFTGRGYMLADADGVFRLNNEAFSSFNRLQLGGSTSSFPAIKRSGVALQARLADDSDFTILQGKLRADNIAVTEAITPDSTIILYDAGGDAFKVACLAI